MSIPFLREEIESFEEGVLMSAPEATKPSAEYMIPSDCILLSDKLSKFRWILSGVKRSVALEVRRSPVSQDGA